MKEEFAFQYFRHILRIFDLDLICRYSEMFCCNIHAIRNHYTEYEHSQVKNESEIHVSSRRQVLSLCDLELCLQVHISNLRPFYVICTP